MNFKKISLVLTLGLLLAAPAFAQVDLTPYQLTEAQIATIHHFEAKGYDDDFILKLAVAFHNSNLAKEHPTYVPPHTQQDLENVSRWAAIGAFEYFTRYTHYKFDLDRYHSDCPSWEIFNFGRATGTQFFRMDVLLPAINASYALEHAFTKDTSPDKAAFQKAFDELAEIYGVAPYLSVAP